MSDRQGCCAQILELDCAYICVSRESPGCLEQLCEVISERVAGLGGRVDVRRASMDAVCGRDLHLTGSEGSVYAVGIDNALGWWADQVRSVETVLGDAVFAPPAAYGGSHAS